MTNRTNKNVNIDLNANDLPFEVDGVGAGKSAVSGKKEYDKPANRWLNVSFVLKAGEKVKHLPLPFGLILDSLEERLAEGIAEGRLSEREVRDQQMLVKVLNSAFDSLAPGTSMSIDLVGRLSKPANSTEDADVPEDEWTL